MPFHFKGETFPQVPVTEMSPAELEQVEQITGLTYPKLYRCSTTCVCEHPMKSHFHFDGGEPTDDLSCISEGCGCEVFAADQPTRATFAYLLIALKRVKPEIRFEDIADTPQSEWRYESDPTKPPPPPQTE